MFLKFALLIFGLFFCANNSFSVVVLHIPSVDFLQKEFAQDHRLVPLCNAQAIDQFAHKTVELSIIRSFVQKTVTTYYAGLSKQESNVIKWKMFDVYRKHGFFTSDGKEMCLKLSSNMWDMIEEK